MNYKNSVYKTCMEVSKEKRLISADFTSLSFASRRRHATKRNDLALGINRVINRDQLLEVCYGPASPT